MTVAVTAQTCAARPHLNPHPPPCPPPPARAQEGFLAFYKGWLPSVIGVIPYVGLNFGVYETLKVMMLKHYGGSLGLPLTASYPPGQLPLIAILAASDCILLTWAAASDCIPQPACGRLGFGQHRGTRFRDRGNG